MALLLLMVVLGSGTALAGRQSAVSPQVAFDRLDGAAIVTSSLCTENNVDFSVWGSGWGSEELILLSVVKDAEATILWFSGSVNEAGAFEVSMQIQTRAVGGTTNKVMFPGAGLFSLEALGTSGRLATAPVLFAEGLCPVETLDDIIGAPGQGSIALAAANTAAFLNEAAGVAAGYVSTVECVASPAGAMGIHYVDFGAAADTIIDPRAPEVLLYLPTDDGPRLVGVEYMLAIGPPGAPVPDNPPSAPILFGQTFDGPMAGHGPDDPPHYDLHVWLWADNPSGLFAPFNPALSCPG
jgi:hypothetical protein